MITVLSFIIVVSLLLASMCRAANFTRTTIAEWPTRSEVDAALEQLENSVEK